MGRGEPPILPRLGRNLSHFYDFEGISKRHGRDAAIKKLQRDLKLNILPEAHEKMVKLASNLKIR